VRRDERKSTVRVPSVLHTDHGPQHFATRRAYKHARAVQKIQRHERHQRERMAAKEST
jgi:hypothetical protein